MTKAPSLTGFAPDNLRGIAWLMASVISASIMALGVRELSGAIDSRAIVFYRALITSLALLIWFAFSSRERAALRFSQPSLHILRSLAIAISTHLGFYAITQMPLVTVSVLFFTAPIFATLLSIFVHKERPGIRRWSAILLGFAGVIVVLRPGVEPLDWPTIAALLSSLLFALALVVSRKLAQADGPISVLLSATIVTLIVSTPLAYWPLLPTRGFCLLARGPTCFSAKCQKCAHSLARPSS